MSDLTPRSGVAGSDASTATTPTTSQPASPRCVTGLPDTIRLLLPRPTPSRNATHGWHWNRKNQERKQWGKIVRDARLEAGLFPPPKWDRAHVTVYRYGARLLDRDNAYGGLKALLDAMVVEGFLVDDSEEHLELTFHQQIGKPYRTEVTVAKSRNSWPPTVHA